MFRRRLKLPKPEPAHYSDPSFLFSTWPIPHWDGKQSVLFVTAPDAEEIRSHSDLIFQGPHDHDRLEQVTDRLRACSGRLVMQGGTYVLAKPIHLTNGSIITGCHIKAAPAGIRLAIN